LFFGFPLFFDTASDHELPVNPHSSAFTVMAEDASEDETSDVDACVAFPTRTPYTRNAPAFIALVIPQTSGLSALAFP
jgi:hypothetical protein